MKKSFGIVLFLVLFGWTSAAPAADKSPVKPQDPDKTSAKPPVWDVYWQWEGDRLPPILKLTLTNPLDTPIELSHWRLTGKNAGEFNFMDGKCPADTTLEPAKSVVLRLVWNRKKAPGRKFQAAVHFNHNRPETKLADRINLRQAAAHLPHCYTMPGFLARQGKPVPRDKQGHIILDDGYHDGPMIEKLLTAFAKDYPQLATLHELGTTWQGRKILGLRITSHVKKDREKPAFLFVAAHHASELLSTEMVLDTINRLTSEYATDPEVRRWVDNYEIWCVPLANPDGLNKFFHVNCGGRKNGRDSNQNGRIDLAEGVDLNRNYPYRWHSLGEKGSSGDPRHGRYRGPSAGSEPETKAIMRLADRERFVMLITYHTAGTRVLVPYTIDKARNPHPDVAWMVGAAMAALSDGVRKNRDYMPVRCLYSVDGVDQDWHYWRYGTLAYLLEGPATTPPPDDRKKMILGARPSWEYMMRRLATGPTLSGHVVDRTTGKPLEAVVSIDEIKTFEQERHTSHPDSGRFDRVLPIEGTYHLRVEKDGYRTEVVEVKVGHEWKKIDVALSPEK